MQISHFISFGKIEKLSPEQIRAIRGGTSGQSDDDKRRERPGGIQTQ
jgi:hypothetical protein